MKMPAEAGRSNALTWRLISVPQLSQTRAASTRLSRNSRKPCSLSRGERGRLNRRGAARAGPRRLWCITPGPDYVATICDIRLCPRPASEDRPIMATRREQDKAVPNSVVKSQALPDVKDRAERIENASYCEKP
jgi:hypothetical protein